MLLLGKTPLSRHLAMKSVLGAMRRASGPRHLFFEWVAKGNRFDRFGRRS
jgi:hypothetical protein